MPPTTVKYNHKLKKEISLREIGAHRLRMFHYVMVISDAMATKDDNWQEQCRKNSVVILLVKTILDMSKKVDHWQESMSKKFCRNFACRNNSHTFARIPVGNILDTILCSKFFCRNYSAKKLRNVRFFTMSKLFLE